MYLNLLIFCIVLSQAIIGTISSQNITESSDHLERKKRVINLENDDEGLVRSGQFPFLVNIQVDGTAHCVGSIISVYTVITSAACASAHISSYKIVTGSVDLYRGTSRNVVEKKIRLGNHRRARASDGIALLTLNLPFTSRYGIAYLYTGPIEPGLHAIVPGWGCFYHIGVRGTAYARKLRSITVPIIPHQQCVNTYRDFYDIDNEDVCIYDPQKHCGNTDGGAPLIINDVVAGIYLKRAENHRLRPAPEIFVNLQHEHYKQWITDNTVQWH